MTRHKPKRLTLVEVTRAGSEYLMRLEDEAGKAVLYSLQSRIALGLADDLDDRIADEEEEQERSSSAPRCDQRAA